jgi:hypothetical protein
MDFNDLEQCLTDLVTTPDETERRRLAITIATQIHDMHQSLERAWRAINDLGTYHN